MGYSMIDIRNLLWHTVSKWRAMIVGALIGAIVIGAIGAFLTLPTETVDVAATQAQIDVYNTEITEMTETQAQLNQYMAESLYMKINYLSVIYTTFSMHVNPSDTSIMSAEAQRSELVNKYSELAMDQELYQRISDTLGYSINYPEQIFTVQADGDGGFLNFTIQSNSQGDNEILGDIIIVYMQEMMPEISGNTYAHTLSMGGFTSMQIVAEEINDSNKSKQEELTTVNEDIAWRQGEIATLTQVIGNQGITTTKIIKCAIFVILGAILGGIMAVGCVFMHPIVKAQVQGTAYIEKSQDINVLATAPLFIESKNIIDNLIYKLSTKGPIKTEEDFLAYLALSINVNTVENERVHVTGTIESEKITELLAKVEDKIHAKVSFGGDVTDDVESLSNLSEADGIILVEKRFATRGTSLEREVQYLRKLDKHIKGAILL